MAFHGLFDIAGLANAFIEKQVAARKVGRSEQLVSQGPGTPLACPAHHQHHPTPTRNALPLLPPQGSKPSKLEHLFGCSSCNYNEVRRQPPREAGSGWPPLALCQPLHGPEPQQRGPDAAFRRCTASGGCSARPHQRSRATQAAVCAVRLCQDRGSRLQQQHKLCMGHAHLHMHAACCGALASTAAQPVSSSAPRSPTTLTGWLQALPRHAFCIPPHRPGQARAGALPQHPAGRAHLPPNSRGVGGPLCIPGQDRSRGNKGWHRADCATKGLGASHTDAGPGDRAATD